MGGDSGRLRPQIGYETKKQHRHRIMKERILFIARYYFSLVAVSAVYKVIFLFASSGEGPFSAFDCLNVLYYGLRHDFAVAGYFTAIPLLLAIVTLFIKFPLSRFLAIYNCMTSFLFVLAFLADISLYPYWGFKLDASVLMYLDSPANAFASVEIWHLGLLVMLLTTGTYSMYRILKFASVTELPYPDKSIKSTFNNRWVILACQILIGGIMFLGIRGGVSESTNNIGTVYFSDRNDLNYAAVNPTFSFLYSFINMEDFTKEYSFFEEEERHGIFNGLYPKREAITDTLLNNTRPNIITIVLEGMSSVFIEELGGMENITPNIKDLAQEGVLFTGCHANSYRTDRGLISILSGYPSFPKTSVMKVTTKSQKLPSLASSLAKVGYNNTFLYGGDINFTNMKGYFYSTGYGRAIADKDFSQAERATHRWGAGDDVTFDRLYDVVLEQKDETPWHITFLTLSSHEPWTVPYNRINDDEIANSFAFTDEELGKFISRLKNTDIWANTLIICISDHTLARYPKESSQTDRNRNHIPFLLAGGAVKEKKRIDKLCNQTDFVATLLAQMQLPADEFTFSRNILSPEYDYPFAYHCFNNGFSFIDSTGITIYNLDSHKVIHNEPAEGGEERLKRGKAILQTTYTDFFNK